eukprot:1951385-Rhodomonas_salina.1
MWHAHTGGVTTRVGRDTYWAGVLLGIFKIQVGIPGAKLACLGYPTRVQRAPLPSCQCCHGQRKYPGRNSYQ